MFRKTQKRTWARAAWRAVYPRGGWYRAFVYLAHRFRRLQDSPGRVARGVFAGTLIAFTPFYGLHFFIAPLLACALGGNLLASIIFVMICNPLTVVPIAVVSISMGNAILGSGPDPMAPSGDLASDITAFASTLWQNALAIFTDQSADWTVVHSFLNLFFLPYLIGGLLVGLVVALMLGRITGKSMTLLQARRMARAAMKQSGQDR